MVSKLSDKPIIYLSCRIVWICCSSMPPRKQPKNLMTFCIEVLAKVFLDIVANIEVTDNQNDTSSKNTSTLLNDHDVYNNQNNINTRHWREESELSRYVFSCLPSSMVSLLVSEIINQFASRWRKIIDISENQPQSSYIEDVR